MPGWARVLVWTAVTAVVLVAGVAAWFVTMLSGGLDDLFGDPRSPDDPAVVEAAIDGPVDIGAGEGRDAIEATSEGTPIESDPPIAGETEPAEVDLDEPDGPPTPGE